MPKGGTVWEYAYEDDVTAGMGTGKILWSNYDVYYSDSIPEEYEVAGTLHFEASEPVPVYE